MSNKRKKKTISSDEKHANIVDISKSDMKQHKGKYITGYTLVTIFSLALVIGIMFAVTHLTYNKSGCDTPKDAAVRIVNALDTIDESEIKNSICPNIKDYKNEVNKFYTAAKDNKGQIKFDTKTAVYEETDWDIDAAKEEIGIASISDAKCVNIRMNTTKTFDSITYDVIAYYAANVYNFRNKWFVYSFSETSSVILDCNGQSHGNSTIGSSELGYMTTNTTWAMVIPPEEELSKFVSLERYKNDMSEITFGKLTMTSINDVTDQYKTTCENEGCEHITILDSKISGMDAKNIIAYDPNSQIYIYIWLFKPPMSDGYVHNLSIITPNPYILYPYIKSYKY